MRRARASLLLIGILSGCSLVPDDHRPAMPIAKAWETSSVTPLARSVSVQSRWWRNYQDKTLDALVDRALANSYTLAAAVATVDQARANAEQAGAPLLPALTLNGTFQRGHDPTSNSGGPQQSLFSQASYEIDFWGLNRANADAAQMLAHASAFDRDTVALTLVSAVADTYFQVQALRRRVTLARAVADDAQHLLDLLRAQQAAGVATELQVQQQRNVLASFQAAVPVLQSQLDQNLHLLATLVGTIPEHFEVPGVALDAMAVPDVQPDLPASVLETRPDIRAQEARVRAANDDIGAARAAFFPNLTLTASGGFGSASLAHFLANPVGSVAGALVAPVFEGGALSGALHQSQAAKAQAVASYRQTVLTAFQEVENALSASANGRNAETLDAQASEAARKAAELSRAAYIAGTVDFLTVLDAERTRYQSEDVLVQARLARLQASVSVFRAFGGGELTEPARPTEVTAVTEAQAQ